MERVYCLYQTFPEGRAADPDVPKNPYSREVTLQPASPAHMSVCQHLRKVIQELVDTEKSYVKVSHMMLQFCFRKISVSCQEHVRNRSGTRQEHVRNRSGTCQEHVRNTSGSRQEHVRNRSGTRQEAVRNTSGTGQEHVRNTSGTGQEHVRNTSGTRQEAVRNTSGTRQEQVRNTSGTGQEQVRNMSGTCQEHVRNTSGTGQEHVRNRSGTRQEHVRNRSGTCQEHVRNTSGRRQEQVRNTSGTRQEHVRNTSGTRQEQVRNMSGTGQEHVRNTSGTRQEHVRNKSGTRQEQVRNTSGTRQEHVRNTSGTSQEHVRNMSGTVQEHVRNRSGTCQEHVRNTSGTRQEHVRNTSGTRQEHDLVCLLDVYLTPLQTETFLSKAEMEALFGSLPQMLDFQRVFLQTLEEKISSCPNLSRLETPEQFKKLLFSLGGSFLYYADHFKLYSGFCANHIKVQKVLERAKTDRAFKHFLETRNPTNQHSSCLESYLIKPVQRVLKYPLLLRELVTLTPPESPEHTHLTEALRAMEKVASHINEMQKIHEDYGCVFDQLTAEQGGADTQVTDVSMGEFLIHSAVAWLNPLPCVGRVRRDPQLTLFVFRRAVILVYRDNVKLKKKTMSSRSADLDPFRFRWLIPVSAVQVRPVSITGSENPCVWELVHSRSEVEGRPETVFQLCSSGLETKASVLRVLSSVLKERGPAGSLRRSRLSTAERSSSWRRRQQRSRASAQRTTPHRQPEESRFILGDTCSEPLLPSHASSGSSGGKRTRLLSLTSELEAQLQRLNVTEEAEPRATTPSGDRRTAEKRRSSSLQRRPGGDVLDLLDRDFSVHSMRSMINEDCFYDFQTPAAPSLQG
ncbi:unnamed protein product [Pleuronectes platessa]|uniref:DH domain-containing protein n=1 Tax=Pleuronectes platessa TaxID=8262 RepID=A0A9N7V1N4_PLEPL|nr:unnamed protein product [Pleuronectes platessa]